MVGAVAIVAALRQRALARADRLALRFVLEREAAFVAAARRLADAARTSIEAVREEMDRAVRSIVPDIDVVLIFEESDALLICVAATGERAAHFCGARLALDDERSLLTAALRCGHRVSVADLPAAAVLHPRDAFAVAIPLVLDFGRRCALYLAGPLVLSRVTLDRIVALIDQATPAYRIALERAEDRARAEFDGLTGLLTARAFRTRLAAVVERARFAPLGRVGVLFVDTDRFKAWNDTYGHASGDALLRELAQLLRAAATDPADIVARNGGDEFCVVFADCEKSVAIERAGRLRASIAAADFTLLQPVGVSGPAVTISASIGVASFPIDAQTPNALLEKADEAMYHSKRTGRDAVAYFGVDGALVRADSGQPRLDPERRRG